MNPIRRLFARTIKTHHKQTGSWETAQRYELEHAFGFMEEPHFQQILGEFRDGKLRASTGYINELLLREFFAGDEALWRAFMRDTSHKIGLDIGPCVFSPLSTWDFLSRSIAIEPLGKQIADWQRAKYGLSPFDGIELLTTGADIFIPELSGKIDGVIHCRNMLDHTPNWPFVLSNISAYAGSGCHLLFWTDIDHGGTADEGHFDICREPDSLRRLIEQLGFTIKREFEDKDRFEKNWGCVAIRART